MFKFFHLTLISILALLPTIARAEIAELKTSCLLAASHPLEHEFGVLYDDIVGPEAVELCSRASKHFPNDPKLKSSLARALDVIGREDESIALTEELIASNYAYAFMQMGLRFQYGDGVTQDYVKAANHFRRGIDLGAEQLKANLADLYVKGHGVEQDVDLAIKLYKEADKLGNVFALFSIAEIYADPLSGRFDFDQHLYWLRLASRKGNSSAQDLLKNHDDIKDISCFDLVAGSPDFSKDHDLWLELDPSIYVTHCQKEILTKGESPSRLAALGTAFYYIREHGVALKILNQALNQGNSYAALVLSEMYRSGAGVEVDGNKQLEYTLKAHDLDPENGRVLWQMHWVYELGQIGTVNKIKAMDYLQKAARKGVSKARIKLAQKLASGKDELKPTESELAEAKSMLLNEIQNKNPVADALYAAITIWYTDDFFQFQRAMEDLKLIANAPSETDPDARFRYVLFNLSPNTAEKFSARFSDFTPNYAEALNILRDMINSGRTLELYAVNKLFLNWNIATSVNVDDGSELLALLESRIDALKAAKDDHDLIIEVARILSEVFEQGAFGPADFSKAEVYKRLAIDYGDTVMAINLGWQLYENGENLEEAKDLLEFGLRSKNAIHRYTAGNNLGVIHFQQKDYKLAEERWLAASTVEIESPEFWPEENLARLYILGTVDLPRTPEKARLFAERLADQTNRDYFLQLLDRYGVNSTTSTQLLAGYLEEIVNDLNYDASYDLAKLAYRFGPMKDAVKWFRVCEIFCSDDNAEASVKELTKIKNNLKGIDYKLALEDASNWRISHLASRSQQSFDTVYEENKARRSGDYIALLIGVSSYDKLRDLATPKNDIDQLSRLLKSKYGFQVTKLNDPTRTEITRAINNYSKKAKKTDTFLIYYAGHGIEVAGDGYWLPTDAEKDDDTNWISNDYITRKLKSLAATNVLVVADSCFAGTISRGVKIQDPDQEDKSGTLIDVYQSTVSRIAITSGNLEPVLDGGGGAHSVFARAFLASLSENQGAMTAMELFNHLNDDVVNDSLALGQVQTPTISGLNNAGHIGPDFVFVSN